MSDYIPTPEEDQAHLDRLALIYKPMPWRVTSFVANAYPCSYPWAGTIIGDAFPVGRSGDELLLDDDDFGAVSIDDHQEGDGTPKPLTNRFLARTSRSRVPGRHGRRILDDVRDAVISCATAGMSIRATAQHVGCSSRTVRRIRLAARVRRKDRTQKEAA